MKTKSKSKSKLLTILPHKPSKLIRLAIRDINRTHKSKRMLIEMSVWHGKRNGRCAVCFAGAVMHYGLKPPHGLKSANGHALNPYDYSEHNRLALEALDLFRCGSTIHHACLTLGITTSVVLRPMRDPHDFDGFVEDMEALAADFEAEGN